MQHKKQEVFVTLLNYINEYYKDNMVSPTISEISKACNISSASVSRYLSYLREEGYIMYDGHRGIITPQMTDLKDKYESEDDTISVPVVGSIVCGLPIDAEQNVEEIVKLPKTIFSNNKMFILKASGESMIEAGIDDGDYVVVRQQKSAINGDIVVALIDGQTTLKGYYYEPERKVVRLQPANSKMDPIYAQNVEIQGVAIRVIKNIEKHHGALKMKHNLY